MRKRTLVVIATPERARFVETDPGDETPPDAPPRLLETGALSNRPGTNRPLRRFANEVVNAVLERMEWRPGTRLVVCAPPPLLELLRRSLRQSGASEGSFEEFASELSDSTCEQVLSRLTDAELLPSIEETVAA